jgi:hypothetical protein
VGRGSLGKGESLQSDVELPKANRRIEAGERILQAERLNRGTERFSSIGHRFFFALSFTRGRNVGQPSRKPAFLRVWNDFGGELFRYPNAT